MRVGAALHPKFAWEASPISGVGLLHRSAHKDERGSLDRLFEMADSTTLGFSPNGAQINVTRSSTRGVLKGLHLQTGAFAEYKIISCLQGEIFDVAVDLRPDSKTCGKWFAIRVTHEDSASLVVPPGCAHGIQILQDSTLVHYIHSAPYAPDYETGVNALDPELGIKWPLASAKMSARDENLPNVTHWLQSHHAL